MEAEATNPSEFTPSYSKSTRHTIPHVEAQVWENLYYPLNGPPKTNEERILLSNYIDNEKHTIKSGMLDSKNVKDSLDVIANKHCSEYEKERFKCMNSFGIDRIFKLCQDQAKKLNDCIMIEKVIG